jgi:hypothetical protein
MRGDLAPDQDEDGGATSETPRSARGIPPSSRVSPTTSRERSQAMRPAGRQTPSASGRQQPVALFPALLDPLGPSVLSAHVGAHSTTGRCAARPPHVAASGRRRPGKSLRPTPHARADARQRASSPAYHLAASPGYFPRPLAAPAKGRGRRPVAVAATFPRTPAAKHREFFYIFCITIFQKYMARQKFCKTIHLSS